MSGNFQGWAVIPVPLLPLGVATQSRSWADALLVFGLVTALAVLGALPRHARP